MEKRLLTTNDPPILYVISLVFGMILSVLATFIFQNAPLAYQFASFGVMQVGNALALWAYYKINKISFSKTIYIGKPQFGKLISSVGVAVGLFFQNLILVYLFYFLMSKLGITLEVKVPAMDSLTNVMLGLIIICILPSIFEELVFRGVFVGAYRKFGATFAIIISAIIFALMHLNLAQLIHQIIVGLFLAYVYIHTGNIIYTMIIHFVNNAMALFLPLLFPYINTITNLADSSSLLALMTFMLVGAIILYPSLIFLKKGSKIKVKERLNLLVLKQEPITLAMIVFLTITSVLAFVTTL